VVTGIQRHGARACLRLDGINDRIFIWGIFVRCGNRAIAAGRECGLSTRIKPGGVDTRADRYFGDRFSGGVIDHDHLLIVATDEKALMCGIYGQAAGRFATFDRPLVQHLQRLGIELDEESFVFVVDEDVPLAIGHRSFGLPPRGTMPATSPVLASMPVAS